MAPSLQIVPAVGANELEVDMLVAHIEKDEVMRSQGYVTKANGFVDPSGLFSHRFVLLTVERRSKYGAASTYYVRVDRRPDRRTTFFRLSWGRARSSDRVSCQTYFNGPNLTKRSQAMLSHHQNLLLAPNDRTESELDLGQPLRLDALGLILRAIRREFAEYKLTKASSSLVFTL